MVQSSGSSNSLNGSGSSKHFSFHYWQFEADVLGEDRQWRVRNINEVIYTAFKLYINANVECWLSCAIQVLKPVSGGLLADTKFQKEWIVK